MSQTITEEFSPSEQPRKTSLRQCRLSRGLEHQGGSPGRKGDGSFKGLGEELWEASVTKPTRAPSLLLTCRGQFFPGLLHLKLGTPPGGKHGSYPPFTDEAPETQRGDGGEFCATRHGGKHPEQRGLAASPQHRLQGAV